MQFIEKSQKISHFLLSKTFFNEILENLKIQKLLKNVSKTKTFAHFTSIAKKIAGFKSRLKACKITIWKLERKYDIFRPSTRAGVQNEPEK